MEKNNADVKTIYSWIHTIRLAGVLGVWTVIAFLWAFSAIDFNPRPILFILLPVYISVSFLWQAALKHKIFTNPLLFGQLIVDIAAVTIGIILADGIHSPFIFLYILIIISATLISLRTVVVMGAVIGCVYAFLFLAEITGFIVFPGSAGVIDNNDIINGAVFVLMTILIGFQSYFFRKQTQKMEKQFDSIKNDFLFRAVHDLRSPSTAIRLIMEKYDSSEWLKKHPETEEDVLLVRDANQRMLNLIRDLLSAAQSNDFGMAFKEEKVVLPDILNQVIKEFGPSASQKNITINYLPFPQLPNIVADINRLKEVFSNLIDNAIKYNKNGGSIFIEHRLIGQMLETKIRDTGFGIAPSDMPNIFKQFFRASSNPEIQGTGLGLYIVKNLVEKMGGKIEIASKLGEGTTFTVSLPLATE